MLRNYSLFLLLLALSSTTALAVRGHHQARHHTGENHTHDNPEPILVNPQVVGSTKKDSATLPPVAEAGPVDLQYLQAYRTLSQDLIKQSYYSQSLEKTGAVAYCTFTLGQLLAVLNEKVFDVPTDGIAKVLKLSPENITDAYADITDSFVEDVKVEGTSFLYTQNQNIQLSPAYKRLNTEKIVLQLEGNSEQASKYINDQIKKYTHGRIVNRLVPKDPNFNNSTAGVFVNTFYYKSGWESPVVSIGQKPFQVNSNNTRSVETLETTGKFRVLETPTYNAVSLPLLGGRKRLVLVQATITTNISLQDYLLNHSQDIFQSSPTSWTKRQGKVQFPAINLVLGTDFHEQLNELAGQKTQCNENRLHLNYIQPVVQVVSLKITPVDYELAVTNGVQVNNMNLTGFGSTLKSTLIGTPETKLEKAVNVHAKASRKLQEDEEEIVEVEEPTENLIPISLTIDKPFFVYLHDNNLGAVSFTTIKSFFDSSIDTTPVIPKETESTHQARHHLQEIDDSKNFSETVKTERWSCHHV